VATTAPERDDEPRAGRDVPRPERPVPTPVERPRTAWGRVVMVLNVVLIAGVAIIGVSHLHTTDPDRAADSVPTGGPASTLPDPDAVPSQSAAASDPPSSQPSATATPTATATPSATTPVDTGRPAPKVAVRMRSDFARGDSWPYGAGYRETGELAWPLGVVDGLMTHGPAQAPNAVSWLERWLGTDLRRIGARVQFAPNHPGSAAITAWHTSVLETTGLQQPRTGMRLVVQPGAWQLVALDVHGQSVISSGTYTGTGHTASFDLVRRDSTIWLTDPDGVVTVVDDPRISSLSGPWASWELRENKVGDRPAGFQEIWAG
jgi:hypothetical protein